MVSMGAGKCRRIEMLGGLIELGRWIDAQRDLPERAGA